MAFQYKEFCLLEFLSLQSYVIDKSEKQNQQLPWITVVLLCQQHHKHDK